MKKNKLVLGVFSIVFCAVLLMVYPESAQAASQSAYRTIFDASYYYETYPDVAQACKMNENALFSHFLRYGISEGRSGSAEFDPYAYRMRYEDLNEAYGDDMRAYYEHYLSCGRAEGRIATKSGEAYVNTNQNSSLSVVSESKNDKAETSAAGAALSVGPISGTYTTYYNESVPRAINVKVSAARINGVTVQPNETFSFSNTILPRTSENGYVAAPVIVSGKMTTGTGGGICQVSSTLYAAMLTAGIPATERHAHSLSMSYIPKGMDATISGTSKDLKFKNIYDAPIVIYASADNGTLTITIGVQK